MRVVRLRGIDGRPAEAFAQGPQGFPVGDFVTAGICEVKRVLRGSFVGIDPGMGDLQSQTADDAEEIAEQAEPVDGIDFDDGMPWIQFIAQIDAGWELCFELQEFRVIGVLCFFWRS